ncbi:hypothetical protein BWI93_25950 [Siphonobacter sp. BAB-5385]|uniref:relaxase/mobilization nuclease domain-containing protein n=1 Tax=Siphonobacter sp. BAB-5385 TaxID=1864822 RepID=UPI000B9E7466|nr:relaxase/mobilization nuclease domain-containing protein [Siphonobacter sp. BAB-5385]OZI05354.1 hypothetical protein BWI93_25950 [Siphonobacter sp. BAB-5385]
MIANLTKGDNFYCCLGYGQGRKKQNSEQAEFVKGYNLIGEDVLFMSQQMQEVAQHSVCKKPVLHISLNFKEEGKLSRQQMIQAMDAYLHEMKIDTTSHQIAVYEHTDTDHQHFHLVVNRVNTETFTAYDDKFIRYKNLNACRNVEEKLGLRKLKSYQNSTLREEQTEQIIGLSERPAATTWAMKEKDPHRKRVREYVHEAIELLLEQSVSSREQLAKSLADLGVTAQWKDDSKGNFVGASFHYENTSITGNAAGFKAPDLKAYFDRQLEKQAKQAQATRQTASQTTSQPDTTLTKQTSVQTTITPKVVSHQPEKKATYSAPSRPLARKEEPVTPKPAITVAVSADELKAYAGAVNQLWMDYAKRSGIKYESQRIEDFPFTELVRNLQGKHNVDETKAVAILTHFERFKKKQLAEVIKKEQMNFYGSTKRFIALAGKIKGNSESRSLFLDAMNVPRNGGHFYSQENKHLSYTASAGELKTIEESPYENPVFIPQTFSVAERKVMLSAISGKEFEESFYNLNPKRLKDALEDTFYQAIEARLNDNYVVKVLAQSPMNVEDKLDYLHSRGIVIEKLKDGSYGLGYIGNVSTGEMNNRVKASPAFAKSLDEHAYSEQYYETSREILLSSRGRMMTAVAQAIDTGNTRQQEYFLSECKRLNPSFASIDTAERLLKVLSVKGGELRPKRSELQQEVRTIENKLKRIPTRKPRF